jgi:TP901 family phage tail tape measure protein
MAQTLRVTVVGDTGGYQAALAKASSATAAFGQSMAGVGRSVQRTGRTLTTHLSLPLIGIGVASVKMAEEFETSMSRIVGLAGVGEKQVSAWSKELLRLGPEVGKSPRELAEALYFVASSGVSTAKAMDVLTASAKASEAGLGDTQTVADAVTSVMNAYGEANITAAEATDTLVAIVREGKGEASEFAPIIGNVVSVASKMGVSFNDVGAALAGMTRLGTDAATAGTQLQAFFSQLLKVTPAQAKALDSVGLSAAGLRQELRERGLLATLETLQTAFHGNTAAMARAFPNIRALRALLALTGSSAENTRGIFERMGDTTGSLAKAFDAAKKRSGFTFDRLKASGEAAGISLGIILAPSLIKVADGLARMAIAYTNLSPQMKNWIAIAGAVAIVAGPLLIITGSLVRALAALAPVVAAVLSPLGLLAVAVAVVAAAFAAAVLYPEEFAKVLQKLGLSAEQAQSVVSTLQSIFAQVKAVVMDAVTAVRAIWQTLGPSITASAQATWNYVAAQIRGTLNIIRGIINVFAGLLTGDWSRLWQGIQQIGSGIWTNITSQFRFYMAQLVALARALWGMIGPPITAAWNAVRNATVSAWNAIVGAVRGAWNAVVAAIRGAIGRATSAAAAVGQGIVNGIKRGMSTIVAVVKGSLDRIWGVISSVASAAFNAAIAIGSAIIDGIVAGIKGAIGRAIGAVKAAGSAIAGAAKGVLGIGSPSKVFMGIGKDVMEGFVQGIIASQGKAEGAVAQAAQRVKAKMQATDIIAAVRAAGQTIGLEHALAIAKGVLAGSPSIVQQVKTALQQGMVAARQAVIDARANFVSAFNQLANDALTAFDARMAAWKPPSQRILDKMQFQEQIKQMNDQLAAAMATAQGGGAAMAADIASKLATAIGGALETSFARIGGAKTEEALNRVALAAQQRMMAAIDAAAAPALAAAQSQVDAARQALATAEAGGDPEAIAAAKAALDQAVANQKQLEAAVQAEKENATRLLIDAEQRRHDQIAAKQREGLAKQLAELHAKLLEHPQQWNTMGAAVQRILASYNVKLGQAGTAWASKFGDGIREGIPAAVAAAKALAAAVAAYMPQSPADKGPLSFDPYKAGANFAGMLAAGIRSANVGNLAGGPAGGGLATATPVGGAGVVVNVTVQGALLGSTVPEVANTIRRELYRIKGRNGSLDF